MKYTSTILLSFLLLVPQSVFGQEYKDPEEVLFEQLFELPPTRREAGARTQLQAKRSADRRAAIQDDVFGVHAAASAKPALEETATEEKTDYSLEEVLSALVGALKGGSAPAEDPQEEEVSDLDLTTPEGRREARINARVSAYEQGLRAEILAEVEKENMHSGAPLAHTGAGTVFAVIVGLGAMAWTLKRATVGAAYEQAE